MHHQQRDFHVREMPDAFVSLLSDEFISVNRGMITEPERQVSIDRFTHYFERVEFERWNDIKPPVIRISTEGTMAYSIVNKEVVVKYQNDSSQWVRGSTEFSWLVVYKKTSAGWKIDAVASTNLPDEELIITD